MAKVVITIEDTALNGVKVEATPNFETMIAMHVSGNQLTAAHGYAFRALNAIREASKGPGQLKLAVPRVRRAN